MNSIITDGVELTNVDPDGGVTDEEEDVLVDKLVKAIEEGFSFSNTHFKGGATNADVIRMRDEAKNENINRKTARANHKHPITDGFDTVCVATIVKNSVSADLSKMGEQIKDLALSLDNSHNLLRNHI